MVIELTEKSFKEEVENSKETVLVDFWASWCGPCRMLSPVVDRIAEENIPGLKVCKVNVDDEGELAARFGIMSIPTLLVFKNGEPVKKSVGVVPREAILDLVK